MMNKKIFFFITALVLITGIYAGVFFYSKISMINNIQNIETNNPWIALIPKNKEIIKESIFLNNVYESYKYRFYLPFDVQRQEGFADKLIFLNETNNKMIICENSNEEYTLEYLFGTKELRNSINKNYLHVNNNVNYTFLMECLYTSSNDLSIFISNKDLKRIVTFLIFKASFNEKGVTDVYRFNADNLKGFQFGNAKNNNVIDLLIFDNKDIIHKIKLLSFKQNEIDYLIQSIQWYN